MKSCLPTKHLVHKKEKQKHRDLKLWKYCQNNKAVSRDIPTLESRKQHIHLNYGTFDHMLRHEKQQKKGIYNTK